MVLSFIHDLFKERPTKYLYYFLKSFSLFIHENWKEWKHICNLRRDFTSNFSIKYLEIFFQDSFDILVCKCIKENDGEIQVKEIFIGFKWKEKGNQI